MSHHLDPLISAKLTAFAVRRRRLIIARGLCIGAITLLLGMMALAVADRQFLIEDYVRWILSGITYAVVVGVVWFTSLRSLLHVPDSRQLARLVEHLEPKLREDLLSAVELGSGEAVFDSVQFRALLQADVAARMDWIEVGSILPLRLLRKPLVIAGGVIASCLIAIAIPQLEFGSFMARALLPMANLARVSHVKIRIVEPSPAEGNIPQGDAVPLEIETYGEQPEHASLEIFTKEGRRDVIQMAPESNGRFSASIQVAREDLAYRIRAGTAITRKYALHAVPRPHSVKFIKKYIYPPYTGLSPKVVEESSGDLKAIEGTEVELAVVTDQPVVEGELRLEIENVNHVIPLTQGSKAQLIAKVPLTASGIYRLHLVATKTGFENKFSPEYELRAEPDLVPKVEMEAPARDLVLPANEVVDIVGSASDDLSVSRVQLAYRVNGGTWTEAPLRITPGPKVAIAYRWDLFQKGMKAGDTVSIKLVAYDLKEQKSETRPVEITLMAAGFDQKRLSWLDAQKAVYESFVELRKSAEALEKAGNDARDKFNQTNEADPMRKQAAASLSSAMDDFEQKRRDASGLLLAFLRSAAPGHQTAQSVLLGRMLGSAAALAQNARHVLAIAEGDPSKPFARNLLRDVADRLGRVAQRVRLTQEASKAFLGSEEIDVVNEYVHMLMLEQQRIATMLENTGKDEERWEPIRGRQRVVIAEATALEQMLTASVDHVEGNAMDRLRQASSQIGDQRANIERKLAENVSSKELVDPIHTLAKVFRETRRNLLDLRSGYMDPPLVAAQRIHQELGPTWSNFDKLREEVEWALGDGELPEETRAVLAAIRWDARAAAIKAHGDFEEARADADPSFIHDVRSMALALAALQSQGIGKQSSPEWEKTKQGIAALDQNFRILESGHDLFGIAGALDHLAASERWEFVSVRASTTHPIDWKWIDVRLRQEADELGRTQLSSEEARKQIDEARQILGEPASALTRKIQDEMTTRFNADREPVPIHDEVEKLAAIVRQALGVLRAPMEQARQQISASAPKLSELAQQLAKDAEGLRQASAREIKEEDPKQAEEAQAEARRELAAQQRLNEKIDALRDALRSDAEKQDLDAKEGRERSRDADDALGMLSEPPEEAEKALADAAQLKADAERQEAFKAASTAQQKLADSLEKISKHYDALEKELKADDSRLALRESEQELGKNAALDRQYEHMEQLAKLKGLSVADMIAKLEKALASNATMRDELRRISQETLQRANEKLSVTSQKEKELAENIQKLAEQEGPPPPPFQTQEPLQNETRATQNPELSRAADDQGQLASITSAAGQEIERAGRHEERLNSPQVGSQLKEAGKRVQDLASTQMSHAEQALATAQRAGDVQKAVEDANAQLRKELQQLEAASSLRKSKDGMQHPELLEPMVGETSGSKEQKNQQQAGSPSDEQNSGGKEQGAQQQAVNQQSGQQAGSKEPGSQQQTGNQQSGQQAGSKEPGSQQQTGNQQSGQQVGSKEPGSQQQAGNQQNDQQAGSKEPGHQESGQQAGGKVPGSQQQAGNQQSGQQAGSKEPGSQQQPGNRQSGQQAGGKEPGRQQQPGNQQNGQQAGSKEQGSQQQPGHQESGQQAESKVPGSQQSGVSQQADGNESPFSDSAFNLDQLSSHDGLAVDSGLTSPEEQKWMARALDLLDSAMHGSGDFRASSEPNQNSQGADNSQNAQGEKGQGEKGQSGKGQQSSNSAKGDDSQSGESGKGTDASAEAKQAMNSASAASKASMRQSRASGTGEGEADAGSPEGKLQAMSRGGLKAGPAPAYKALPEVRTTSEGEWGKLPKQVAEQLSQGQRETVPSEYRNQVETYYRVIAEKAQKP